MTMRIVSVDEIDAEDVSACDLLGAYHDADCDGTFFRVAVQGEAQRLIVYEPATGPYGVVWGANASWIDAPSPRAAVQAYFSDGAR